VDYAIRIPANKSLELEIEDILFRPPGRPSAKPLVRFYIKRGTAEQWIKEGKQAAHWTRLSCHRFRANEVGLRLSVLAYSVGNLWRWLGLPNRIKRWSLTSLQHRLMKTGGRLVRHARYHWLLLAEGRSGRGVAKGPSGVAGTP
jgi:hypothetical protein